MKKIIVSIIIFCMFINIGFLAKAESKVSYETTMKRDLLCLMMAYPEYIINVKRENNGDVYLLMKSGKKVIYDDKKNKNFNEKLYNTDIQDMMEQEYPLSSVKGLMDKDFDPGRIREYNILKEVYGGYQQQIQANLKNVGIVYQNFLFNKNNNAATALQNVMKELAPLTQTRNDIRSCVLPCSGTFNYRVISGTNLLSPHSFGIAIDLASDRRDYWKWTSPQQGEQRLLSYPEEIVKAFEKNNFVWGGKWSHFDILHFEYRPEIILKARYFGNKPCEDRKWYIGSPYKQKIIKNYIKIIDNAI